MAAARPGDDSLASAGAWRHARGSDAGVCGRLHPPLIAVLDLVAPMEAAVASEEALIAVVQADTEAGGHSAAMSRFMMRTESVASSKIERITASATDYAKALAGNRSNSSATSMVAASTALHDLVTGVGDRGEFTVADLLAAHYALIKDDPAESRYAGRLRDGQNWIGGSAHSPRDALHIPPAPSRSRVDGRPDRLPQQR